LFTPANSWCAARADRAAVLVDADAYYTALYASLRKAQREVLLLGWDIDSRLCLRRDLDAKGRHEHGLLPSFHVGRLLGGQAFGGPMIPPTSPHLARLVEAVRANCQISDARHARNMTMCTYLLEMRELHRWELGYALDAALSRADVGAWLSEREAQWDAIEHGDYLPLPSDDALVDPFAAATINGALVPRGWVYGAGVGHSPLFYVTIGSGIGGGLIVNGEIYRAVGKGAAEIGHLRFPLPGQSDWGPLERIASGWSAARSGRSNGRPAPTTMASAPLASAWRT
jgi:hypothetical protein